MLEISAALEIVLSRASLLAPESTFQLLGRVLAEDIASDLDSPPFAKSTMDGYALRSADSGIDVKLTLIEEVPAGRTPTKVVGPGQTTRVMTGAPIPDGADAVVPHELVDLDQDSICLRGTIPARNFILPRGKEMRTGEVVLPKGTQVNPPAIGLLAAVGRTSVQAYPIPRVAVVSTGDEIVEAGRQPGPSQIRNSNGPMLQALGMSTGAATRYMGIAPDQPGPLANLLRNAFDAAEIVVISGGVSAGSFDFVPGVLKGLGVETHFHKINLKPGKPLLFGTLGSKLVFGLPGNPVSSFVGFELFVRPAVSKMAGYAEPGPNFVTIPLATDLKTDNNRVTFLPGRLEVAANGYQVRPGKWFGSADLRAMLTTNALIRVPAGDLFLPAGTLVSTLPLKW